MPPLQPPRAPSDRVRIDSFRTLSRLQLIFEFRVWLEYLRDHVPRRYDSPMIQLWDCMSFGAPICTLLDLLGSPTPVELRVYADTFNFNLSMDERITFIESFIHRINILEIQGRIPYGEVLKVDDFISGGVPGYVRVLRTLDRILNSLHDSYPGIFVAPQGWKARRASLIQQLKEAEAIHVSRLSDVAEAASRLYSQGDVTDPSLEGFIVNCSRLIPYHNIFYQPLGELPPPGEEIWDDIFMFSDKLLRTNIIRAYHSLCANYLPLVDTLSKLRSRHLEYADDADMVLRHLSFILGRISDYREILQAILEVSMPMNKDSYDSLCRMTFEMYQLSESIDEAGFELRTIWAARCLKMRLGNTLRSFSSEGLGTALLDDRLVVDPVSGDHYSVFLFQSLLICCKERSSEARTADVRYPMKAWELGPALSGTCPLSIVCAVPTKNLMTIHCFDAAYFELFWVDGSNTEQSITFYPTMPQQYTQWVANLQLFVTRILHSTSVPNMEGDDIGTGGIRTGTSFVLTAEETMYEPRRSTARAWSVIGRKGPNSESSSLVAEMGNSPGEQGSILSPNLLPTLFTPSRNGESVPASPNTPASGNNPRLPNGRNRSRTRPDFQSARSPLRSVFTRDDISPLNNAGRLGSAAPLEEGLPETLDLTGQITREGNYAVAHGGHSDVWLGRLKKQADDSDQEVKVAVKVLRNTTSDPEKKAKLVGRLQHELRVWKQLDHMHVLPLYGVTNDFGPYPSMVCPWMEKGSVSKYLEHSGDILDISERLRIIGEIMEGLQYLHLCSIIHGDLTGSNILLDTNLTAYVCDFGLSAVVLDTDTHTRASFTSHLGGAVRWTDSCFFENLDEENKEWSAPPLTYKSDVYSLGCVMLEILSGRPPYHYIALDAQVVIELHKGNKPRRPARSFVDDGQWELIQWCWTQPPEDRPDVRDVAEKLEELVAQRGDVKQ
ncbi:TKL/TKL-ccin protein kinase [Coprinopsis cinerea okayama7|uniref:TKL/TKL-ccin protein kinase n=1 Tax=Coprinopsis cinerea (strain Okayama-7 / 130 / ATCC MYA-4618 / FGSC 9003) TaxID=240176 RepID=A8NQJ6_COPC7|nr:TKL/TKL-ccin protein kinase [Coprinopsis cinerea okayama7\|eukprot:XP_001835611.2 TKL/TKL-ccin protein kinase [Coprinopsis cinerea okayama7\